MATATQPLKHHRSCIMTTENKYLVINGYNRMLNSFCLIITFNWVSTTRCLKKDEPSIKREFCYLSIIFLQLSLEIKGVHTNEEFYLLKSYPLNYWLGILYPWATLTFLIVREKHRVLLVPWLAIRKKGEIHNCDSTLSNKMWYCIHTVSEIPTLYFHTTMQN